MENRSRITCNGEGTSEAAMSSFLLAIAVVLGSASLIFYAAGPLFGHGSSWAYDVCSTARPFCEHPEWPGIAAIFVASLYVVMRMADAARG